MIKMTKWSVMKNTTSVLQPRTDIASTLNPDRVLRTRVALLDTATILFAQRPPDAVSIDEITRSAGVAKGSFYNHFRDKTDLFHTVIGAIREQIEQHISTANHGMDDPAMRVARAIAVYVRFALDAPQRASIIVSTYDARAAALANLQNGLMDDLAQGLALKRFRFATVEAAALFVEGVARHVLLRVLDLGDENSSIAIAQQMCGMLLRGIGVDSDDAGAVAACALDDLVRTKCKGDMR